MPSTLVHFLRTPTHCSLKVARCLSPDKQRTPLRACTLGLRSLLNSRTFGCVLRVLREEDSLSSEHFYGRLDAVTLPRARDAVDAVQISLKTQAPNFRVSLSGTRVETLTRFSVTFSESLAPGAQRTSIRRHGRTRSALQRRPLAMQTRPGWRTSGRLRSTRSSPFLC